MRRFRTASLLAPMLLLLPAAAGVFFSAEPLDEWLKKVVFIGVGRVTAVGTEDDNRLTFITGIVEETWKGTAPQSVYFRWTRGFCFNKPGDADCLAVGDRFVFLAFTKSVTGSPVVTAVSPMGIYQLGSVERFDLLYRVIVELDVLADESVRYPKGAEYLKPQVVLVDPFCAAVKKAVANH